MLSEIISVPDDLKKELSSFVKNASDNSGDNVVSIYLFGGVAKQEFDINNSDINILIILKKSTPETLDLLNKALEKPLYKIILAPFIITEDELENSASLFPVKFLDIKTSNVLLYGKDLLDSIQINHELLKRNTRRELKNILFRLNLIYIHNSKTEEVLGDRIKHLLSSLSLHLTIMYYLKKGELLKTKDDIIEQAGTYFSIDIVLMKRIYLFKKGTVSVKNSEMRNLYGDFMNLVKDLSIKADNL